MWAFARLWERICETLGEDLWGFARICKDSQDFGREFMRICKDLQDFGRGFARIHGTLGEDYETLGEDS